MLGKSGDLGSIEQRLGGIESTLERLSKDGVNTDEQAVRVKEKQIESLGREKVAKEIELDRVREEHAREKREIEHMIGLHKKRVEQEIDLAKREQIVTLREESLEADRKRFEDQMNYIRERMEEEQKQTRALVSEMLARLPVVTVDKRELQLVEGRPGR